MKSFRSLLAGVLLCTVLGAMPVSAQVGTAAAESRLEWQLRAGLNHADNLGREAEGESETFGSVGTSMDFQRESSRVRASVQGSLDYNRYDSNRFDNEVIGRVDGLLGISLLPQRVDWLFENRFGQIRADPFEAEGPDNREYLNVFTTGPDVYLPLGERTTLAGRARYTDRRWQDSDELDSDILGGEVRASRQLTPTQLVGLTAGTRRVSFDGDVPSYEVQSAYASYQRRLVRGEVEIDLGANRLRIAGSSDTGSLVRVNWTRELTARSTLSLRGGREFQDAGDQLRGDSLFETGFRRTGDAGISADPFVYSYVSAQLNVERDRASFDFGGGWSRERYDSVSLRDRDALFGDAGVSYRFTRLYTGQLRAALRRENFDALADGTADEITASVALLRRIGRSLDLALRYEYAERSGDVGVNYTENRYSLYAVWFPGRR
jgi:hypothetical protein